MLAVSHGGTINLFTLTSFLLSYHDPTSSIHIGDDKLSICLLKRVRIGEYIGPGRNSGVYGGKEYLVAGSRSGDLFIIESPSYHCSKRLPLFPSPAITANLLPSNLGRRLRSTLLVSSVDGTASIVDIERSRVMVTFPAHDYTYLNSFATKKGQNVIALTYQDGVCREWNMAEEGSADLMNPPPSRGSVASRDGLVRSEDGEGEWKTVNRISRGLNDDDREEEGEAQNGDGTLQLWNSFCRIGLPTVGIDIRAVLQGLEKATQTASQRTRKTERRVVGNHPAITNAKSLLTALVPNGTLDLFLDSDDETEEQDEEAEWGADSGGDLGEWRFVVDQFFYRRKIPATQGLIGAGNRISMLTADAMEKAEVSPTVTSIKLLAVLTVVSALLDATGKEELKPIVLQNMLKSHLGKKRVALGAFAKFWSDANPLIRWVSRECLDAFMSALTEEERNNVVEYWRGYLPVYVPPELSSVKEVSRSVIVLGKLITDYDHGYNFGLKKAVAKSAEMLLNETTALYQDTAIEVIGYSWSAFENLFDAYEVIHALVRISTDITPETRRATLHRCILDIAAKNSPLLASSLANNISRGTPSSTPTASLTSHALQDLASVSIAAMNIVVHVVRVDAMLFRDVLALLVEAVVKILDPNGGLREKVLPTVTELVDAMVEAYPTVAFHRPTQRLALSAAPGIIMIYDLKSCTTAHWLDGHHHLATHLSFSTDGRYIAAVDLDENLLLVWRFVSGIWSVIGQATTGESDKTLAPRVKKPFVNSHNVSMVDVVVSCPFLSGECETDGSV